MIYLNEIGSVIRQRRQVLGLSQTKLAHYCDLSRQTIVSLERGTLHELGFNRLAQTLAILGLELAAPKTRSHSKQDGLWAAAKTASVSYTPELSPRTLADILATGEVPASYIAHVAYLLDEAPPIMLIRAVESASNLKKIPARQIWKNIAHIARDFDLSAQEVFA